MSGSLGPFGDSLGLTVLSVYALAVVQLPVTFLITLNFQPVKSDFYSTGVRLVYDSAQNATAIDLQNPTQLHYIHSVSLSVGFLAVSGLCTVFTIATVYLRDKGLDADSGGGNLRSSLSAEEYTTGNIELVTNPTITLWNNVFLGLVVLVMNSPFFCVQ